MVFQKQRVLGQAEEVSTGNLGCRSKLPADWHLQNELVGLVGSHKMDMWPWITTGRSKRPRSETVLDFLELYSWGWICSKGGWRYPGDMKTCLGVYEVVTPSPSADCCSWQLLMKRLISWELTLGDSLESSGTIQASLLVLSLATVAALETFGVLWEVAAAGLGKEQEIFFPLSERVSPGSSSQWVLSVLLWLILILPHFVSYLIVMTSRSPAWERGRPSAELSVVKHESLWRRRFSAKQGWLRAPAKADKCETYPVNYVGVLQIRLRRPRSFLLLLLSIASRHLMHFFCTKITLCQFLWSDDPPSLTHVLHCY